jgi:hypothetical protein
VIIMKPNNDARVSQIPAYRDEDSPRGTEPEIPASGAENRPRGTQPEISENGGQNSPPDEK